jgi:NAD(P)-dependent dehydrogenase (short-subunit alcohol dehydrogenase family)
MLLRRIDRPLVASAKPHRLKGAVLIIDRGGWQTRGLVEVLEHNDLRTAVIDATAGDVVAKMETLLASLRQAAGCISGLIYLAPAANASEGNADGVALPAADATCVQLSEFFEIVKSLESDLRTCNGCVLVATRGDGAFCTLETASPHRLADRGLAGMVKSLAREWSEVSCRIIDFEAALPQSSLNTVLINELLAEENVSEAGYLAGRRILITPAVSPIAPVNAAVELTRDSVVLITGGARGITAEVAVELARRFAPKLVLVGRSPLPPLTESTETDGITEPKQLKTVLRHLIERSGEKASPARIEAAFTRLLWDRDIRATLAAIRSAGATFEYHAVDVSDAAAFGGLIDRLYAAYGRIDGVIHGAGVTEDKFVHDKTVDSFRRVLAPKIIGGMTLARKLRPDTLKFLFFFSSVSARYGNRGQADYAAANDVLNALAQWLNRRWPARVASLNWGPWESTGGMVSPELAKQFAKAGIVMISRPAGRRLFLDELMHGRKEDVEVVFGGPIGITESAASRVTDHRDPLLNDRAELSRGPGGATEISRVLDPAYDLYLLDHQLDGKPVMPMAMSLELLAEIASSLEPDMHLAAVRDLRVLKGITLHNGPQTLRVRAQARHAAHGSVMVDLRAESMVDRPQVCYTASVELKNAAESVPPPQRLALTNPRPLGMTIDQAYEKWLFHGPLFAGIVEIEALGENGIIARLSPSSPRRCLADGNGSSWLIDPVVVDSGLQLLILWARTYLDMTPLPSRLGCYHRVAAAIKGDVRCEVRIRSAGATPAIHADLMFYDASGALLGWLEDMEVTCSKALNRLSEVRTGPAGADA